ncbi:hypothetical protein [Lysinibacillus sp. 54212]|uniref:hypothetical protein n=1 Tax=Lysinibacillus sp. 54212 TaxID=3119829 RepID=UPI002FC63A9C
MGLFMNNDGKLGLFKSNHTLIENNQIVYHRNEMTELIREQQTLNQDVHRAIQAFKTKQNTSILQQSKKINRINDRLHEIQKLNIQQREVEQQIIEWLEKLENRDVQLQTMLVDEQLMKNDLLDRVAVINQDQEKLGDRLHHVAATMNEMAGHLDQYTIVNNDITHQLQQVRESNEQIIDGINSIDEKQQEVMNRVEDQEGLIEKISRQLDNVRSIVFERTHFLDEKIKKMYDFFNRAYSKNT